jgi:hypothetical protein
VLGKTIRWEIKFEAQTRWLSAWFLDVFGELRPVLLLMKMMLVRF